MSASRATIGAIIAALLASVPARAAASCKPPEPRIVWSYPSDGATDVPTNAHLFFLTSVGSHVPDEIVVNGVAVPKGPIPFGYQPVLAPRTGYTVEIPAHGPPDTRLRIQFATGDGPRSLPKPDAPSVGHVTVTSWRELSPSCLAIWSAMDCFDTGQNRHVIFETRARPLFWLIEPLPLSPGESPSPRLWPAECGAPEIYAGGFSCGRRYRLRAVEIDGQSDATDVPCDVRTSTTAPSGCAVGTRGSGLGFLLGALVLLVPRVRRARRTTAC